MRFKSILMAAVLVVVAAGVAFANVGDFGGTSWRVVAYNIGQHNHLEEVTGHDIIVNFGHNGRVTGTGVYNFAAGYNAVTGRHRININTPTVTHRASYTVADTDARAERAVMKAMGNAVYYRMAGGQLDLLYPDGRIAATMLTTNDAQVLARRQNLLMHAKLATQYDRDRLAGIAPSTAVNVASVTPADTVIVTTVPVTTATPVNVANVSTVRTYTVYRAGDTEARIEREGPDSIWLTMNGETFRLRKMDTPDGVKYVAINDPKTELWERDGRTIVVIRGERYPDFIEVK